MAYRRSALALGLTLVPFTLLAGEIDPQIELGRQLFEENWLRPPADDSPAALSRHGDGLGPLFNGASCAECHRLGGVGGAGPNEHNVEIVSLALPFGTAPDALREATRTARATHPEFARQTNVFLHRFGVDRSRSSAAYDTFRGAVRSEFPDEVLPASQTQATLPDGLTYQLAQRNTPALWGVGLLEDIPPRLVAEIAERQKRDTPAMAGIAVGEAAVRFGWRGQTATLQEFVRDACANELGLTVRGRDALHDQSAWPLENEPASQPRSDGQSGPPVDLSAKQVAALVAFVRSLPAPRLVMPDDPEDAAAADAGRQFFDQIGCAVCHVPDIGTVTGVYSDLLLHDMGPTFADRVMAPLEEAQPRTETRTGLREIRGSSGGSYGGSLSFVFVPTETTVVIPPSLGALTTATQAFRTPPLWGVADSEPYLHDGRAESLDDAIRMHTGQAQSAADRYVELPDEDRRRILAFLGTLRAPQPE